MSTPPNEFGEILMANLARCMAEVEALARAAGSETDPRRTAILDRLAEAYSGRAIALTRCLRLNASARHRHRDLEPVRARVREARRIVAMLRDEGLA